VVFANLGKGLGSAPESCDVLQAIHGVGIDWTFAGEAVEHGGFLVRATAVSVSLGGMMVTALMLGLVSGASPLCMPAVLIHSTPSGMVAGCKAVRLTKTLRLLMRGAEAIGYKMVDFRKGHTEVLKSIAAFP
jgi:hypothetical protein